MKKSLLLLFLLLSPLMLSSRNAPIDTMEVLTGKRQKYWEDKNGNGICFLCKPSGSKEEYSIKRYSMDDFYKERLWDRSCMVYPFEVGKGMLWIKKGKNTADCYIIQKITDQVLILQHKGNTQTYRNAGDLSKMIKPFPPFRRGFKYAELQTSNTDCIMIVEKTVKAAVKRKWAVPNAFNTRVSVRPDKNGLIKEIYLTRKTPSDSKYDFFYTLLMNVVKRCYVFLPDRIEDTGETFDSRSFYEFSIRYGD